MGTTTSSPPSGRGGSPPRRSGWRGEAMSAHAVAPILLASTSPQLRVIIEQLGIPFDAVAPNYEEHDPPDADPVNSCRRTPAGKRNRSRRGAGERPVLGVDTSVWLDGSVYGSRRTPATLSGCSSCRERHTPSSRPLPAHIRLGGPRARIDAGHLPRADAAGARAAQPGAGRVGGTRGRLRDPRPRRTLSSGRSRRHTDVVGLPAALLVRLLAERFPGAYGLG